MNAVLQEYVDDFNESSDVERYERLKLYNTPNFIEILRNEEVTMSEITEFLKVVCRAQIELDGPLPTNGYIDMVRFSRDHNLFLAMEGEEA